jgi:phosphatidylethanolamine/phosphatidyl-N-methylethanolamine N-methyltransferase
MQPMVNADLDGHVVEKAYARWAPIYDAVCGPIFERGRQAAAKAACRVGGRILEVGVGTGLSFDDYDEATEVFGIDLCEPMIAKARQRLAEGHYPHIKSVGLMDAHSLAFPDGFFDCVVAQFVITLVASPEQVLSECARVVKPGGEIILVNHLYSERGATAAIERWFARYSRPLGLRPEFPFARLAAWAQHHGGVALVERQAIQPFGIYTLVRFRRTVHEGSAVLAAEGAGAYRSGNERNRRADGHTAHGR